MARTSTVIPSNSLSTARQDTFNSKIVEYDCNGQKIKLSPQIIRSYLVNGGGNVTDQEVAAFLNICRYQKLNPFLREAYLVKYGNNNATIVTGKETFEKRAFRNRAFEGKEAGVIILHEDGSIEDRIGSFTLEGENIVGGWAKVYVKGYVVPVQSRVSFHEYVGKKADGTPNNQWATKPGTMIRKVALVQALREAFPEEFEGLYAQEEMADSIGDAPLSEAPLSNPETSADIVIEPEAQPSLLDDDPLK